MKEEIKNFFKNAEGIWIFGSFAKANYNNKSDIDIAVLYKEKKHPLEIFKLQEELSLKFDRDIDLVDLADVNDIFAYEIVTKGIKINLLSIFRIIYKLCRPCYTVPKL